LEVKFPTKLIFAAPVYQPQELRWKKEKKASNCKKDEGIKWYNAVTVKECKRRVAR
jgi:hypothetical protein